MKLKYHAMFYCLTLLSSTSTLATLFSGVRFEKGKTKITIFYDRHTENNLQKIEDITEAKIVIKQVEDLLYVLKKVGKREKIAVIVEDFLTRVQKLSEKNIDQMNLNDIGENLSVETQKIIRENYYKALKEIEMIGLPGLVQRLEDENIEAYSTDFRVFMRIWEYYSDNILLQDCKNAFDKMVIDFEKLSGCIFIKDNNILIEIRKKAGNFYELINNRKIVTDLSKPISRIRKKYQKNLYKIFFEYQSSLMETKTLAKIEELIDNHIENIVLVFGGAHLERISPLIINSRFKNAEFKETKFMGTSIQDAKKQLNNNELTPGIDIRDFFKSDLYKINAFNYEITIEKMHIENMKEISNYVFNDDEEEIKIGNFKETSMLGLL